MHSASLVRVGCLLLVSWFLPSATFVPVSANGLRRRHLATTYASTARSSGLVAEDRQRNPDDEDYDSTIDIPANATVKDLIKGPGAILSGLPWWAPLAIGWFLAPAMPESPLTGIDIFAAPTARQERQIRLEERSLVSDRVEMELYGK